MQSKNNRLNSIACAVFKHSVTRFSFCNVSAPYHFLVPSSMCLSDTLWPLGIFYAFLPMCNATWNSFPFGSQHLFFLILTYEKRKLRVKRKLLPRCIEHRQESIKDTWGSSSWAISLDTSKGYRDNAKVFQNDVRKAI